MGGLYDLLETYRIQNDPRFAYEGLYQDPLREDQVNFYNNFRELNLPYGLTDAKDFQPFQSSAFPQGGYGVGSLFNPRVGKSRQSIYFNEPSLNVPQDFYQPIGDPFQTDYPITRTIQEEDEEDQMIEENIAPYTGVTGMGYQTPRTIADQNRVLGQTFTEEEEPKGIADLLRRVIEFTVPGLSFLKNIAGGGQPYQQFSPGTTIRNGIVNVAGVNTPYSMFGGDFYNPNTGLNRFDRAAERFKRTGSMADLFASSRTGKEFFEKRRQIQAQKQKDLEEAAKAKRQFKQDTGGGGGGGGSYTPSVSASQAAANRESRRGGQYGF